MKPTIALLILLAATFAGCSGKSGEATTVTQQVQTTVVETAAGGTVSKAPSTKAVSDNGGSIIGTVTNDELKPIQGVRVFLAEFDVDARTDDGGRYAFTDVPAGSYALTFEHPSYEPQGRKGSVEAGKDLRINVVMLALPTEGIYHETIALKGYIVVGEAFVDILACDSNGGKCTFNYVSKAQLFSVVIELDFVPSTPAMPTDGNTLYHQLRNKDSAGALYSDGYWKPKQKRIIEGDWDRSKPVPFNHLISCHLTWACVDQHFTAFVTMFYGGKAEPTFSVFP
jgi:hypothetical protein